MRKKNDYWTRLQKPIASSCIFTLRTRSGGLDQFLSLSSVRRPLSTHHQGPEGKCATAADFYYRSPGGSVGHSAATLNPACKRVPCRWSSMSAQSYVTSPPNGVMMGCSHKVAAIWLNYSTLGCAEVRARLGKSCLKIEYVRSCTLALALDQIP